MALPTWFVIGAPKAGTTALADWLREHPGAHVAPQKEVSFFDEHFERGLGWYAEQFADATPGQACGEATPAYLYDTTALDRLRDTVPDARLVVLVREPVARVWSHVWYFRYLGLDLRDPETVIRAELADPTLTLPQFPQSYLGMSRYVEHLEEVTARFDREQLLVAFSSDLRSDADATYARICRHLGLAAIPAPDVEANVGRRARWPWAQRLLWRAAPVLPRRLVQKGFDLNTRTGASYPPMPEDLRASVREALRPANRELAAWLGRELPDRWAT